MNNNQQSNNYLDNGTYFGYPKCCIKEFLIDLEIGILFVNKRNRMKRIKAGKNGFIPCKKHARLINKKEITIDNLIKNRICPTPFPIKYLVNKVSSQ